MENLRPETKKKLMRSLHKSQKLLSTRLARPKKHFAQSIPWGFANFLGENTKPSSRFKENKIAKKKRAKTAKNLFEVTDYFNSFYFKSQKEKMTMTRSKRPQTSGQAISHFIKMTKNGPMKYRRVLSKRNC